MSETLQQILALAIVGAVVALYVWRVVAARRREPGRAAGGTSPCGGCAGASCGSCLLADSAGRPASRPNGGPGTWYAKNPNISLPQ